MLQQQEAVLTLTKLGLTLLQARVYLALATNGDSNGKTVAKTAKVASQDIYRVLVELQEAGLAEKIIAKPNRYRPTPLNEGIQLLLSRRSNETAEIEKSAQELLTFSNNISARFNEGIGDFVLIPKKEALQKRIITMFENAQVSIDLMNDDPRMGLMGHELFLSLELKALDRGVKIRDIICKSSKADLPKPLLDLLKKKPQFQVKCLNPPPVQVAIKDNKEIFISTMKKDMFSQPYLWSTNEVLVKSMSQLYNMLWQKATNFNQSQKPKRLKKHEAR